MTTSAQIKDAIAKLRKVRHVYQQKGNKRMIDDTLKREALLEKELVKIQWKERQIGVIKAQKNAKERQKALAKEERELKWGPALNTLRSIGRSVGGAVKQGTKKYQTHMRKVAQRHSEPVRTYHPTKVSHTISDPDPYHTSANTKNGYNMEQIDSSLAEKVRRTKGG